MQVEQILVVDRSDLFSTGSVQGISTDPIAVARFLRAMAEHGRFVPRSPAEQDETLKQIVPYGVVLHEEQVFLFRRGIRGAEAGLRGRWSLGLGGHVNPADGTGIGPAMLEQALLRELAEEVTLERARPQLWAVLNDDEDPVGRRHFGFIYRVWVATPAANSREPGKIQGQFVPLEDARKCSEGMETWSRLVLQLL